MNKKKHSQLPNEVDPSILAGRKCNASFSQAFMPMIIASSNVYVLLGANKHTIPSFMTFEFEESYKECHPQQNGFLMMPNHCICKSLCFLVISIFSSQCK